MSAGQAPSRGWRWAAFAAASFCAASATAGGPAPQDTFLDFNDNQVPAGWSLVVSAGGDNCGVAKRRFFAGQFENDCALESPLTVLPSTQSLTVKWKGNLSQSSMGSEQDVQLWTSSTPYGVSVRPTGDGNTRVVLIVGDHTTVFDHSDLPDGVYSYTLQVTSGNLNVSALLNGTRMFKHKAALSSFTLDQIQKVELSNAQISGVDRWMDNVSIRQISN